MRDRGGQAIPQVGHAGKLRIELRRIGDLLLPDQPHPRRIGRFLRDGPRREEVSFVHGKRTATASAETSILICTMTP
jgi:hypothetical protein